MALSGDNFSWLKKSFILQGSEVTWHYGPVPDSAADNEVISEATESGRKNDNPQLAQMSLSIADCWCNAEEKSLEFPTAVAALQPAPSTFPGTQTPPHWCLFPEMIFNCQRKLKVKTLSIPLKTVYFYLSRIMQTWTLEKQVFVSSLPLLQFRISGRLCCHSSQIHATNVAYPISVKCHNDNYSGDSPMIGCCAEGKGKAKHSPQMCCTTRWYH